MLLLPRLQLLPFNFTNREKCLIRIKFKRHKCPKWYFFYWVTRSSSYDYIIWQINGSGEKLLWEYYFPFPTNDSVWWDDKGRKFSYVFICVTQHGPVLVILGGLNDDENSMRVKKYEKHSGWNFKWKYFLGHNESVSLCLQFFPPSFVCTYGVWSLKGFLFRTSVIRCENSLSIFLLDCEYSIKKKCDIFFRIYSLETDGSGNWMSFREWSCENIGRKCLQKSRFRRLAWRFMFTWVDCVFKRGWFNWFGDIFFATSSHGNGIEGSILRQKLLASKYVLPSTEANNKIFFHWLDICGPSF